MAEVRTVCVFCGSRVGSDPAFGRAAIRLGEEIVRRGVRLVYGGGSIGLMGLLADAVLDGGGDVIGLIPGFLMRLEVGHPRLSQLVITESMHERKHRMFALSDAFIVLPGGLGTLDETFEIITWKQIRIHDKPIVVIDVAGYWSALVGAVDMAIASGFAHPAVRGLFTVVTAPEDVFDAIAAAPPPAAEVLTSHL